MTRFSILIVSFFSLSSCTKNLPTATPVTIEQFRTFVQGNTFHVTAYYNEQGELDRPLNSEEDVYRFVEGYGIIDSKEPCIEYTVPLRVYEENGVKMDWVNLEIQYETFEISEVGEDYFVLNGVGHSIRYSRIN